jgi:hypothetical protein
MFVLGFFFFFLSCARRPTTYSNEMHNQAKGKRGKRGGGENERGRERERNIFFFTLSLFLKMMMMN